MKKKVIALSLVVGDFKLEQKQLMRELKSASYKNAQEFNTHAMGIRLFLGLGRRNNELNRLIKALFDTTEQELVLYTPYFNFPAPLMRSLRRLLKQGKQVTIVVGDKTANDFYLPPSEPFSKIGALPYLYETILHKFVKSQKRHIDNGNLNVYLWKHESNSFHLKGICCDRKVHLLSGHNLNPRAWGLDIENGILIEDPEQSIMRDIDNERQEILKHCRRLTGPDDLELGETIRIHHRPCRRPRHRPQHRRHALAQPAHSRRRSPHRARRRTRANGGTRGSARRSVSVRSPTLQF